MTKSAGSSRTPGPRGRTPENSASPRPNSRRHAHGKRGEKQAAEYLEQLGLQILARNWRSKLTRHEIDLIAKDGNCIVFVEVKSARTRQFGDPLAWITPRKQAAIIKAALAYLSQWEAPTTDFRFDAIAISPSKAGGKPILEHLRGAFTCDLAGE